MSKLTTGTGTAADIAKCCINSAALLELADADCPDLEKRKRLQGYNQKQAELLRHCAAMLMGKGE